MSDEPDQKDDKTIEWSMPEPVFRSSKGRAPGEKPFEDSQLDIPTEPGFRDPDDDVVAPAPPARKEEPPPKPSKGGGCARTTLSVLGLLTLSFIAVMCLIIYLVFYSRPASTAF